MRNASTRMLQRADLTKVHMYAVRSDQFGVEQALFAYIRDDRHAILIAHVFHFEGGLGQMGVERHIEFLCQVSCGAQDLLRAGIWCMRGNRRDDQRMVLPLLNELARHQERIFVRIRVRCGKLHHGLPTDGAHAGICGGLDLGWNLKRGGPDLSVDFIVDRRGGQEIGVDIARDYDNTGKVLQLTWAEDGPGSHYKAYSPRPSCN